MQARQTIGSLLLCAFGIFTPGRAQSPAPALSPAQTAGKASPAVAMVLAAQSPGETSAAVGAALPVYANGDLLTSYHLIRNAYAVQVRLQSGEVFDRVRLLGVDERRDIAAIRIAASGLTVLPTARAADAAPGDPVVSISHPLAAPWFASTGVLSAYRMADEIPGAVTGFHVLQFTAPDSPGASGGVLLDAQGRVLGLIPGALTGGQSLNYAVPIENILGLADTAPVKTFASGAQLVPGQPGAPHASAPQVVAPPAPVEVQKPEDLTTSRDREFILRHFKTMYVDAHGATYFSSNQLKASLVRNKDFAALNIAIVDDPKTADAILVVGYSFAWDFPFELKHPASSIVLLAGKGTGPLSGIVGATSVAREFVKAATPYRVAQPPQK